MTDDQLKSLRDDIDYVKGLAAEGATAPLLSGPILVAAALIFGPANALQWAIQAEVLRVDPVWQLWLWVAAAVLFGLALSVLIARSRRKPGYFTAGNRAVGAAWSGVGFGIFAIWVSFLAMGLTTGEWVLMLAMPAVVFAAYGTAWGVASAMTGKSWMNLVALLAYAGTAVLGLFIGQPEQYLVFGVLMVFVALIPGLVLMRQEPGTVA